MHDVKGKESSSQMISMYVPIFREKLERMERRGEGRSDEAIRLRTLLAEVDRLHGVSGGQEDDTQGLAAA
ncbi:MAG: hypothetical protein ACE363_03980 [Alphaproteobacteria bacterium]